MGNRSRYVAATAAAATAGLVSARRRARLKRAAEGIREAIMPTHVPDLPTEAPRGADGAHAPGHRHMGRVGARGVERRRRGSPGTGYFPGMRGRLPDR